MDLTLQAANVFSDYDRTRGYLAQLYDYLPDAFSGYNDTQFRLSQDCMTDNAVDYWGVARYHSINADAYDATNHWFADFYWNRDYKGIRGINQYLLNARADVVGNAEKKGDDNRLFDRWDAEARVLRAILHFDLVSWFGDIPVVADGENGTPIILAPSMALPSAESRQMCSSGLPTSVTNIKTISRSAIATKLRTGGINAARLTL